MEIYFSLSFWGDFASRCAPPLYPNSSQTRDVCIKSQAILHSDIVVLLLDDYDRDKMIYFDQVPCLSYTVLCAPSASGRCAS